MLRQSPRELPQRIIAGLAQSPTAASQPQQIEGMFQQWQRPRLGTNRFNHPIGQSRFQLQSNPLRWSFNDRTQLLSIELRNEAAVPIIIGHSIKPQTLFIDDHIPTFTDEIDP